jgi:hypothetical protein
MWKRGEAVVIDEIYSVDMNPLASTSSCAELVVDQNCFEGDYEKRRPN